MARAGIHAQGNSVMSRALSVALAALLVVSMSFLGTGCSQEGLMPLFDSSPNEGRYDPIAFDPSLPQGPSSLEASKAAWTGDEQGFWHAHIEGRARKLYDVLYPHFAARDTEFELGSLEDLFEGGRAVAYYNTEEENARHLASMDSLFDDYNTAVLCIKYDHPELFWLESEGATLGVSPIG